MIHITDFWPTLSTVTKNVKGAGPHLTLSNVPKLSTHEDFYHMHKILGVLFMLLAAKRFLCLNVYQDMFYKESGAFFWTSLLLHMALSSSSLIFKTSMRRSKNVTIVWTEAKLHTIVFTTRSVLSLALYRVFPDVAWPVMLPIRAFLCLSTMKVADFITQTYAKEGQGTIRRMPSAPQWIRPFYSICQFGATHCTIFLHDGPNRVGMPHFGSAVSYTIVFSIQLHVFLYTLTKKGIISTEAWHFFYTWSLCVTLWLSTLTNRARFGDVKSLLFGFCVVGYPVLQLRKMGWSKYLIWVAWPAFLYAFLISKGDFANLGY